MPIDRAALELDDYKFNVHMLIGGQVKGDIAGSCFMIYPQGNPLQSTEESPYLQIGETKYGRPILDRGIRYDKTTLEEAAKYALLSMDSTMKSQRDGRPASRPDGVSGRRAESSPGTAGSCPTTPTWPRSESGGNRRCGRRWPGCRNFGSARYRTSGKRRRSN